MRSLRRLFFQGMLLGLSCTASAGDLWAPVVSGKVKPAAVFLDLQKNLEPCESLKDCSKAQVVCSSEIVPDDAQVSKLREALRSGDLETLKAMLLIRHCLQGGTARDFDEGAGILFEKKPAEFFKVVLNSRLDESYYENLILRIPLDLTDKILEQRKRLELRLSRISQLKSLDIKLMQRLAKAIKEEIELRNNTLRDHGD